VLLADGAATQGSNSARLPLASSYPAIVKRSVKVPPEVPTKFIVNRLVETVKREIPYVWLLLAASQLRK
jgi:hypothetical protein